MYVVDNSNACGLTVCKHKFWDICPDLVYIDFFLAHSCGCPSDKVAGHGCFGASLMLEPEV